MARRAAKFVPLEFQVTCSQKRGPVLKRSRDIFFAYNTKGSPTPCPPCQRRYPLMSALQWNATLAVKPFAYEPAVLLLLLLLPYHCQVVLPPFPILLTTILKGCAWRYLSARAPTVCTHAALSISVCSLSRLLDEENTCFRKGPTHCCKKTPFLCRT